jgi:hypothetical protein
VPAFADAMNVTSRAHDHYSRGANGVLGAIPKGGLSGTRAGACYIQAHERRWAPLAAQWPDHPLNARPLALSAFRLRVAVAGTRSGRWQVPSTGNVRREYSADQPVALLWSLAVRASLQPECLRVSGSHPSRALKLPTASGRGAALRRAGRGCVS